SGALEKRSSAFELTLHEASAGVKVVRVKRVRIERDGALERGVCLGKTLRKSQGDAAAGVRFGQVFVQFERLVGRRRNVLNGLADLVLEIVVEQVGIAGGDARVSTRVAGIELDCFGEHPSRDLIITLGMPMKEFPAA